MLERYARVFDTVEVNSTFYAIPPGDRVEPWERASPDGFRFGLEAPGALTARRPAGADPQGRRLVG